MNKHPGSGLRLMEALPEDGERRLMLAVLMDAIRILRQPVAGQALARQQWLAEKRWFESDDPRWPFSFVAICNALGLDASYIRRRVLTEKHLSLPMKGRRYAFTTETVWDGMRHPSRRRASLAHPTGPEGSAGVGGAAKTTDIATESVAPAAQSWERAPHGSRPNREDGPRSCTADAAALPPKLEPRVPRPCPTSFFQDRSGEHWNRAALGPPSLSTEQALPRREGAPVPRLFRLSLASN